MSIVDDILNLARKRKWEQKAAGLPHFNDPFQDFDELMAHASRLEKSDRELLYFLVEYFFKNSADHFIAYYENKEVTKPE